MWSSITYCGTLIVFVSAVITSTGQGLAHAQPETCDVAVTAFSANEQQALVDLHNEIRASVSPEASNMIKLVWSDAAAQRAQAWVNLCQWEHGYMSDCDGNYLGQNIAYMYGTFDAAYLFHLWSDEAANYTYSTRTCDEGAKCGHYTQIVWAKTSEVGCGWMPCEGGMNYLACNYFIGGNNRAQFPYELGTAGSACGTMYMDGGKSDGGLCVPCDTATDADCACPFDSCQNEGTFDRATCRCTCTAEFWGDQCENPCVNSYSDSTCERWQSDSYCEPESSYYFWMSGVCAKTCKC